MMDRTDNRGYRGRRGGFRGGFKRAREDEPVLDRGKVLLSTLLSIGDDCMPELQIGKDVVFNLSKEVKEMIQSERENVQGMLLKCIIQVSTKIPLYSVLVGLIRTDDAIAGFVEDLLTKAVQELDESLRPGGEIFKAQSLLRFLAQLIQCGVIPSESFMSILKHILEMVEAVPAEKAVIWQPYTDFLTSLVLGALPFAGESFCGGADSMLEELIRDCEKYVENRHIKTFENFRPFAGNVEEDPMCLSDCGAGGNLAELLLAIKEMQDKQVFSFGSIPNVYALFDNDLASTRDKITLQPISLTWDDLVDLDTQPAQILEWYPPKGIIRLMKEEHTKGDRLLMERIIAEDYFLHTIHFFEGSRVECAKRLARSMPLNFSYDILLCETIFGQMLRLPGSEFKTIMYGTLMVDLCKLIKSFPRPMSACVRECFARMKAIDPCLSERLAEWLAYHVSNYDFAWPWERWSHVLDAPESDYQRRFCVDVIHRMIRLSYWDRVSDVLPENFKTLLPPKPHHEPLPDVSSGNSEDLEGIWAAKAVELIRNKTKDEQLDDWMKSNALEAVLGGKVNLTKMLLRALLVAGQKTYSHMIIALERYYGPLAVLISEGGEDAQIAALDTIWQVWSGNTQRAAMAIDRVMTLRLVSAKSVVSWVFESGTIKCTGDPNKYVLGREGLFRAVDKVVARVEDVRTDIELLVSRGTESNDIDEKRTLLMEYESQRSATISVVVQNFVSLIDNLGSQHENLGNLTSLVDIPVEENEIGILLYDLVRFAQAFIRHYYKSVSACSEDITNVFATAKFPLTKSISKSAICL